MKALVAVARIVCIAIALCAVAAPAFASLQRPNATDKRVTALPAKTLLALPARALVDPDRQTAASRLVRWKTPGWIVMILAQIFALAYFWRSGGAALWRDRLRRAIGSEPVTRFVFGASLAGIARIAAFIPDFYLYRVDRGMGLSVELTPAWFGDWVLGFLGALVLAGFLAMAVLWIADRTHQWYIYVAIGFVGGCLLASWAAPIATEPVATRYETLSLATRPDLHALVVRSGVIVPISVELRSQREQTQSATYDGLWSTRRVVVSDTLVAGSTPRELAWAVAVELGHIANGDLLRRALLQALILILGATIGVFIADRIGFRRDDDPVSRLALVGALFGAVFFVAIPVYNVGLRGMEAQADIYAANLTRDPSAGVRMLVRGADENLDGITPGIMANLFFERTPSIAERIGALNGKS